MKKFFKIIGYIIGGVIILVIAFLIYFNAKYPQVDPPSNEKVEITPARVERGKYLTQHVSICVDCHSSRDWTKYAGPLIAGTLGKGGEKYDEAAAGIPGVLYAKNITPTALGSWSDGEIMRAITCGVSKDNTALFPLMPYTGFSKLSKEDLYSIVAYLRSLPAIKNDIPERSLNFPLNLIVKTMPFKTYSPSPEPNRNNPIEYGKYLVTIANCFDCHTQMVKGDFIKGKEFAGGFEFHFPFGVVRSANITPDANTGIGSWTKEQFIQRFKSMDADSNQAASIGTTDFNTPMPWTLFGGMSREDLGAIYDYLKTIKPVNNVVVRFTPNQ